MRVYGRPEGGTRTLLTSKDVRGREGLRDSIDVPLEPGEARWYLDFVAVDTLGNESCPTTVTVEPTVGVPQPGTKESVKVRWYDVAGRRVDEPRTPGIYYRVEGTKKRTVVVIR